MLHPIGRQPAGVYWRRRLLAVVVVLLVLVTAYVVFFRDGKTRSAAKAPATSAHTGSPGATSVGTGSVGAGPGTSTLTSPPAGSTASSAPPAACTNAELTITSKTDAASYPVGAKPEVSLVVLNRGPAPCVADLSDGQIELQVFSGGARVWGSHDCAAQSGSSPQTLPVGAPVTRAVAWSGLTSQPGCAGQRQRVPAGSYTMIASLAGRQAPPATFAFAAP